MTQKIKVGTAGFYRMRGLLFPGLTDETPDEAELLVPKLVAIKTTQKFLKLWNVDLCTQMLSSEQLESLMEVVTNINILLSDTKNQELWLKSKSSLLKGKSLFDLLIDSKFDEAKMLTRNALV